MKAMNILWLLIMFNIVSILFSLMGIWSGSLSSGTIGSFITITTVGLALSGGGALVAGVLVGPENTSATMFFGLFTALWNTNIGMINGWANYISIGWWIYPLLAGLGMIFGVIGMMQIMSGGWQSHV